MDSKGGKTANKFTELSLQITKALIQPEPEYALPVGSQILRIDDGRGQSSSGEAYFARQAETELLRSHGLIEEVLESWDGSAKLPSEGIVGDLFKQLGLIEDSMISACEFSRKSGVSLKKIRNIDETKQAISSTKKNTRILADLLGEAVLDSPTEGIAALTEKITHSLKTARIKITIIRRELTSN